MLMQQHIHNSNMTSIRHPHFTVTDNSVYF